MARTGSPVWSARPTLSGFPVGSIPLGTGYAHVQDSLAMSRARYEFENSLFDPFYPFPTRSYPAPIIDPDLLKSFSPYPFSGADRWPWLTLLPTFVQHLFGHTAHRWSLPMLLDDKGVEWRILFQRKQKSQKIHSTERARERRRLQAARGKLGFWWSAHES